MHDPTNPGLHEFAENFPMPPVRNTGMRQRSGIRRTCFYPIIGTRAGSLKLHNHYLKPDIVTDPVAEYWAVRRSAGLFDVTGEEVIEIAGPEALAFMNDLVPRNLDQTEDGQCVYCIMCYDYGGIVEDAILARFSRDRLWWIGGPGYSEQWLYTNAFGRNVTIKSFLDDIHVASLQGPKSREILQRVSDIDLSRVPFFGLAEGNVCGLPVTISRTGYTAELGYDIYVPAATGAELFGVLYDSGRTRGVELCGSQAINLRRVEASILNFGQDFDWQHTPYEVGLGWMVNPRKDRFTGREALVKAAEAGPARQLVGLHLSEESPLDVGARLRFEDRDVGEITSAIRSPQLDRKIAISMVESRYSAIGTQFDVQMVDGDALAEVVPMPFFDPERLLSKV